MAFPNIADMLYLASYPLHVVGLPLLVRARTPGCDVPSMIDVAIVPMSAGLLAWIFVISPPQWVRRWRAGWPPPLFARMV